MLHLLPGDGRVGAALTGLEHIDGVAFTGSTQVARLINRALAARDGPIVPLVAETGGLDAMFIDTSALKEQVIDDTMHSAFGSAGQRCSPMRLIFLPREGADGLFEGLKGAMDALKLGDPADPATDIGPVIDSDAVAMLETHLDAITGNGARLLHRAPLDPDLKASGLFFAPVLVEIDTLDQITEDKFGPILHVMRYKRADLPKIASPAGRQALRHQSAAHSTNSTSC